MEPELFSKMITDICVTAGFITMWICVTVFLIYWIKNG